MKSNVALGLDGNGKCMISRGKEVFFQSENGWRVLEVPLGRTDSDITTLTQVRDGSIWLGTSGDGILVLDKGKWYRADIGSGLGDGHITAITEDRAGAIWIGTRWGGLTRFTPNGY
jgi:ligand-binding sensor domain-containing protein